MADIPNVPGVPPLPSFAANTVNLLTADLALGLSFGSSPWGIYYNGIPVVAASAATLLGFGSILTDINSITSIFGVTVDNQFSVVDFDFKQDWTISDYPVELGNFLSYDKVQLPFDVRMRVAAGGSQANRQALLDIIEDAANTTNLYDVVTPERVYPSCNISHFDYRRQAANGLGLLVIDVWLTQIRNVQASSFSNVAAPGVASPMPGGAVQPFGPSPQEVTFFMTNPVG